MFRRLSNHPSRCSSFERFPNFCCIEISRLVALMNISLSYCPSSVNQHREYDHWRGARDLDPDKLPFKDSETRENRENIIADVLLYERVKLEITFYLWVIIYRLLSSIGMKELSPPALNLKRLVKETVPGEPILIVISPGADPSQVSLHFGNQLVLIKTLCYALKKRWSLLMQEKNTVSCCHNFFFRFLYLHLQSLITCSIANFNGLILWARES